MSFMFETMGAEPQAAENRNPEVPEGSPEGLGELIAAYRSRARADAGWLSVELGRAFLAFRNRHGWSAQKLGRAAGITAGTVHHYESLLTLAPELITAIERGHLMFKEGRALADINGRRGPDHDRQREIAEMFLSGRVSSVYVESVVWAAKADSQADIDTILARAIDRVKKGKHPPKHLLGKVARLRPDVPTPTELKLKIIDLAAMLTKVQMQPYCETEMLAVRSVTRILIDRLKAAGVYEGGVRAPVNGGKA